DDFIRGNGEGDASERHLDRGERNRGTRRIPEYTRQLDETAERIADETERSLLRERDCVDDLGRRTTQHLRRRAGGHRRRGTRLRLTAAFGARSRRALSHDGADQTGRGKCVY